jgi:hypothetical protein
VREGMGGSLKSLVPLWPQPVSVAAGPEALPLAGKRA